MTQMNSQSIRPGRSLLLAALFVGTALASTTAFATNASTPRLSAPVATPAQDPVLAGMYPGHGKTDQAATALRFVEFTGITKNLSLLLLHDVKDEAPVQTAIKRHGMDKVQNTVVRAIRSAQSTYAPAWNQMLAGIYLKHFDDTQLLSILTEREASPHFGQLIATQAAIADEVKEKGGAIFSQARTDVMARLLTEL